jgi:predicted MFS family arabinose efflux permease
MTAVARVTLVIFMQTGATMSIIESQRGDVFAPVPKAMAGLLALAVAMGIGRFAFTPILPMMLEDAGVSIADGSLLASANYIGYLLGAVFAMMVHIPNTKAIRGGLIAIVLTTLAMGLKMGMGGWLFLRLAAGVASAWVLISVSAWSLEALARYRQPILNGVVFAGVGSGIAVAGLLCMTLSMAHASSSLAWLTLGLFSCIAAASIWRFFKPHASSSGERKAAGSGRLAWSKDAVRLIVCYGMFGFGYIIPATFLPVMAKQALRDATVFGWSWPVFGAAAALSTLAVSAIVRHIGNRRLWSICHFVMAVGVALPVLQSGIVAIFLSALLVGGTFMVITLCAMQEAKRISGNAATMLIAAMTSAFAVGQIAGPLCVAYLFNGNGGFAKALLVSAFMLAASAIALMRKDILAHASAT